MSYFCSFDFLPAVILFFFIRINQCINTAVKNNLAV